MKLVNLQGGLCLGSRDPWRAESDIKWLLGRNCAVLCCSVCHLIFLLNECWRDLSNLEENYGKVRAVYMEGHVCLGC